MKLVSILVFFLSLYCSCLAQDKYLIFGNVKDEVSKKPLSNVNVYLANTMAGCVTDSSGNFRIQFSRPGNFELVVSILGYEVTKRLVDLDDEKQIKLDFSLTPKVYVTDNIGVTASIPEEWNDNYRTFKQLFIGKTDFAKDCTIENKEEIDFVWENSDLMTAQSQRPVRIINKALGFSLDCVISKFEYNKKEMTVYYVISPRFTLLKSEDASQIEKWEKNRRTAYGRSVECFFSSLIHKDYWKKGYSVYWDRSPFISSRVSPERVLRPDELVSSKRDVQNEEYVMSFDGYLKIQNGDMVSWLKLLYPEINLNKSGYPRELLAYKTFGYWSTLGIANLLPLDYKIDVE